MTSRFGSNLEGERTVQYTTGAPKYNTSPLYKPDGNRWVHDIHRESCIADHTLQRKVVVQDVLLGQRLQAEVLHEGLAGVGHCGDARMLFTRNRKRGTKSETI